MGYERNKIEKNIRELLEYIGEDVRREGLKETPKRVVNSWLELYAGYFKTPSEVLGKVFKDGACKEMVVLKDIEFYSTCEHHMLPFFGKVHVGYIPDKKVVGISKLARLVDVFARRLQIQEKMTAQIAEAIMEHLQPKGCMVIAQAQHFCMTSRGVQKQNSKMVTSAIRGDFEKHEVKQEFMELIR